MKKFSALFQNDNGYVLPLLLALTTFTLIIISALLLELQHSQLFTKNEREQIQLETLFQMAHATVLQKSREQSFQLDQHYVYEYPYGHATVRGSLQDDQNIRVEYHIKTKNNSTKGVVQYISFPSLQTNLEKN
ncbi:hypothetical protein GLW08_09340 [Pontibacillus yanchengensis]|uniref:Uncharacterized protein n=2 Tax=Pontibacillus yanchengensis TaxID=462910 RepID=A0ACC7VFH3_9BACI|nr:hypothetical protein [Pontibacillus yanchengensis]MYL33487.1 hypothetical protein [Pontibacillus yanchengensis]MYL53537.1 hypothetical protein [Pontibacillus yanchengensis]